MLQKLRQFFDGFDAASVENGDEQTLRLATAALLVEAARMDETLDDRELDRVRQLVAWRFSTSEEEAADLVAEAQRQTDGTAQVYRFASIVRNRTTIDERLRFLELMWDVAYADGQLDSMEAHLMRRVAHQIGVSDRDSADARHRVLRRLGLSPGMASGDEA